jgi:hypothetical protein
MMWVPAPNEENKTPPNENLNDYGIELSIEFVNYTGKKKYSQLEKTINLPKMPFASLR